MTSRRVRRVIVACAAVAALTATMVLPAQASTDVFHSSFKGQEAAALLSSLSGCTETDALVVAEQSRLRDGPGAPARQTDVQVQVIQIDECAPTLISDAFGSAVVPDSAFTIDKKLSSAQLNTTIEVTDSVTSTSYIVGVNVTWTGTGATTTTKSHIQQKVGNATFMENFHGANRGAEATGTITRGETTLLSGTSTFAAMFDISEGILSITRQ